MLGGDSIPTKVKPSNAINISIKRPLKPDSPETRGISNATQNSIIMLFPTPHDPSVEGVIPSDPESEEGAEG
jgi:hypothetical protein